MTASPDVVGLAVNKGNWPKSDNEAEQPEKLENQNNDIPLPSTNMGSHSNVVEPDTKVCDSIARLRLRNRLRELAEKRRRASNNNNGVHTLLDQNIVTYDQITPVNAVLETHLTEPTRNSANDNTNEGTRGRPRFLRG